LRHDTFRVKTMARLAVAVFLVLILISEVLLYTPGLSGRLSVSVQINVENGRVLGSATIRAPVASHVRQAIYLVHDFPAVNNVYFYYDSTYPWSYSNPIDWFGLSQHIGTVSGFRGSPISADILNANQLAGLLTGPPAGGEVLIVASGVLPDTVFTKTLNLVTPWIENGGTLIWIGDKIGTYSGVPGTSPSYPSSANPGNNGTRQFLNLSLLGGTSDFYNDSSSIATAFNLNYIPGIPNDDLNVSLLPTFNGTTLGNLDGGFTNLASIPVGLGHLVYFGGPTQDATNLGTIVVNLLETGAFTGQVELINVTSLTMTTGSSVNLPFDFAIPSSPFGPGPLEACSFLTQTDYLALFGLTSCLSVG
jgi:hypothetical protein